MRGFILTRFSVLLNDKKRITMYGLYKAYVEASVSAFSSSGSSKFSKNVESNLSAK